MRVVTKIEILIRPDDIHRAVHRLQELPPLPRNEQHLLAVLSDDDLAINGLVQLMEECPTIAARIMGLAGSAFFAQPIPVRSISDVIIRVLGLKLVKSLIMAISGAGAFKADNCPLFVQEKFWYSSLLTATLASYLAPSVDAENKLSPDQAYLCGLLHNLGTLALVHVAPTEMNHVFSTAVKYPHRSLIEIETEILGIHHGQAGALLALKWHLPERGEAGD